ncbi:alpha-D-ribose 1-methylphosphonate 5-triphosphate synthase subunit PhnI [Bradyrhizobium sp. USDA 4369]
MAYVATRGGEHAIEQAERLYRDGLPPLDPERITTIQTTMPYLIDRVIGEGSLHSPELAALALAQSGGDLYEAVLLLRAWRTTQPRLHTARPLAPDVIRTHRRISAAFKDIPGGQILGATLDYSHRMLQTEALTVIVAPATVAITEDVVAPTLPSLAAWQKTVGLVPSPPPEEVALDDIPDITREPLLFPASRAHWLQSIARADTGGLLALGYSLLRGYGSAHPTVNELRLGEAEVRVAHPCGTEFSIGRVRVSTCEMIAKSVTKDGADEALHLGFAATLGWNEVKVIAGSTLDLNSQFGGEQPAERQEFVLYHTEPVESSGFCIHLKLPHYVTFQSSLDALRGIVRPDTETGRLTADDVAREAAVRTARAEKESR